MGHVIPSEQNYSPLIQGLYQHLVPNQHRHPARITGLTYPIPPIPLPPLQCSENYPPHAVGTKLHQ
jgi:hypothetical protein